MRVGHNPATQTHAHPELSFLRKYIFSEDHKIIGIQFLFSGLIFLFIGGMLALLVRIQIAWPYGTIPIIGASKVSQIEDSLAALGWTLTEKEMQLLDEVSNIELGFPHDFLQSRNVKKAFWGSTFDQVDRVRPIAHVDPTRMAR